VTVRWRHLLGFLVVTGLLAASLPDALGQGNAPAKVSEIRIEGNKQMSAAAVKARIKTRVGANYGESLVRGDERRLLETGWFESVVATRTYTEEGVVVVFNVSERPLVSKVVFQGNATYEDAELAKELTFGVSEALNRYSVEAGRQALLNKYKSSGFHFVTVELDQQALGTDRAVIYRIVEGPQSTVTKVRFEGNRHFRSIRLRRLIGTSMRIWPFVSGHLDVEQISRDVQAIKNLYIADGHLDVKVDRELTFSDDKKKVTVTFVIDEGPRFRIDRVIFEGNTVFRDEELSRPLKFRQGVFFTALNLARDARAIRNMYGELGYIDAEIGVAKRFLDPTADPPAWARELDEGKPALMNVIFRIRESDQYRIARIDIRGNTVTQERVIRRELRFFPEQLLNMVAVSESQRRLMETRLFDRVTITPVGRDPATRTVLVDIKEGQTGNVIFGVGINSNSGLGGNVTFSQRNFDILRWPSSWSDLTDGAFKGAGQQFRISAEPGVDMMRFYIDWFAPYLFDRPYSLGTRAFVFTHERENYDETRYGGVVSVGHRFKNRWYGEVSSRVEGVRIHNLSSSAPPEVVADGGTNLMTGVKGKLVRDRTDSRWWPADGDRFNLSYEQVVGDFNFGKAIGDYRIYRTIYMDALDRKHVIAARIAVGQIFGSAPVFESFYGGGIGSLRGFDYRGISPRSNGTDEPIGGEFMIFAGAEYRFPIVGEHLYGVVFLDTGTVEETCGEFGTYRASAGAGLRWIVPMLGPIPMSLDFGFPISKDGDDDTELVSFSIGWTF
jgi:outer membrane protein assembly complex protein YaeT